MSSLLLLTLLLLIQLMIKNLFSSLYNTLLFNFTSVDPFSNLYHPTKNTFTLSIVSMSCNNFFHRHIHSNNHRGGFGSGCLCSCYDSVCHVFTEVR